MDGEGATVLLEVEVGGAASAGEANAVAKRIATSPLVKTAAFGRDPNWGRVLAAAGSAFVSGGFAQVDVDRLTLRMNGVVVFAEGEPTSAEVPLDGPVCKIELDLGLGDGRCVLPGLRPHVRLREDQRGVHDVIVVKVGGAVVGSDLGELRNAVVVHGGGPQISAAMEAAGLEVTFVHGRRFTSAAAIEVVRSALLDVNAQLCVAIGPRAVGLAGDEVGLRATRLPGLGNVGTPVPSRPQAVAGRARRRLDPRRGAARRRTAERQRRRGRRRARDRAGGRSDPVPDRRPGCPPRRPRPGPHRGGRGGGRLLRGRDRPEAARRGRRRHGAESGPRSAGRW